MVDPYLLDGTKEELRNFIEEKDGQIEEICKLINYVYKYQYRKENPFDNYVPTMRDV